MTLHNPSTSYAQLLCHSPLHAAVAHGKAYSITDANGQAMRFCQQCSRLQPLEMFSGDRRSCVASLEKREFAVRLCADSGVESVGGCRPTSMD